MPELEMTSGAPLVETDRGAVRGCELVDGTRRFAGIPFAAPPVGRLRLRPPERAERWSGILDATHFRTAPLQQGRQSAGARADEPFRGIRPRVTGEHGEDCLYLNVWRPSGGAERRPVIFWIHGGGFEGGSAAPPHADGAALARQTGAVVVAADYRLGALGWLHLADLGGPGWTGSTNLGLQDLAAALRWTSANIEAFGGDPASVTLFGASAGALCAGALLAMPAADGLYHRAILHSASAERVSPREGATALAADLLTVLGLDEVDELLEIPAERIVQAQRSLVDRDIGRRNLPGGRGWGVVLDGEVLARLPAEAVADGGAAHVPLLVGWNRDEVTAFRTAAGETFRPGGEEWLVDEIRRAGLPDPESVLTAYRERLAPTPGGGAAVDLADLRTAFLSDAIYRNPACRLAASQVAAGGRAFTYVYADEPFSSARGAAHGFEQPYQFDAPAPCGKDTLLAAIARFVARGEPGWPVYGGEGIRCGARRFGPGAEPTDAAPADAVDELWWAAEPALAAM